MFTPRLLLPQWASDMTTQSCLICLPPDYSCLNEQVTWLHSPALYNYPQTTSASMSKWHDYTVLPYIITPRLLLTQWASDMTTQSCLICLPPDYTWLNEQVTWLHSPAWYVYPQTTPASVSKWHDYTVLPYIITPDCSCLSEQVTWLHSPALYNYPQTTPASVSKWHDYTVLPYIITPRLLLPQWASDMTTQSCLKCLPPASVSKW